jgi:hypothetical protein
MLGWYLTGLLLLALLAYYVWRINQRSFVHWHDEGERCNAGCGRRR